MLTNCLPACSHLTITVSEIERDIGQKSSFFIPPPCIWFPQNSATQFVMEKLWYGKTRMVWVPDGGKISKISLFVLVQLTHVKYRQTDGQTDRQTLHAGNSCAYA